MDHEHPVPDALEGSMASTASKRTATDPAAAAATTRASDADEAAQETLGQHADAGSDEAVQPIVAPNSLEDVVQRLERLERHIL